MKHLILTAFLALSLLTVAQEPPKTCQGTTTKGEACKSTILLKNGFCRVHNPERITCIATTSKGEPCKIVVNNQGDTCHIHLKSIPE